MVRGLQRVGQFFGLAAITVLWWYALFANSGLARNFAALQLFKTELASLCKSDTQWIVFACLWFYFVLFQVLLRAQLKISFFRLTNSNLWLGIFLLLVSLGYFFDYGVASTTSFATALVTGVLFGQGASYYVNLRASNTGRRALIIGILLVLLVTTGFIGGNPLTDFQYRGSRRWVGPWDNPNTFGLLMGVGVLIAIGFLYGCLRNYRNRSADVGQTFGNFSPRLSLAIITFFLAATGLMVVGLAMSFSRAAWLGVIVAIIYVVFRSFSGRNIPVVRKRSLLFGAVIVVSICVIAFWNIQHSNLLTVRRALSVSNPNDFSSRKRIAAYEAALTMVADRPWAGFGWNQPDRVYDHYYRKPKIDEGMAIQLNDYLTIASSLGIPAALLFISYVWLRLRSNDCIQSSGRESWFVLSDAEWFPTICCAGAIVLLVGFWFDGGLFKTVLAIPFWVLLEIGRISESDKAHGVQPIVH